MKKVIHFARKFLPPTASFIYNQMTHHKLYEPYFIYCEDVDSVFRSRIINEFNTFKSVHNKIGEFSYNYLRKLTVRDNHETFNYIKSIDPDVLHIHYGVDALIFSSLIKSLAIPTVVSFYGYDCTSFPQRYFRYGQYLLRKYVFHNPAIQSITAMSPDMADDLIYLGCPAEKIIIHYHGIDTTPFYLENKRNENDEVNLLMISGLEEKKGHLFLLKAFQKAVEASAKKLNLTIVGAGPMENEIRNFISQQKINNVNINKAVSFGSKAHIDYLKNADIFVHPSVTSKNGDKEGIPGAVVEAMASGLPVISTFHAGIPYVLNHNETGLLVNEWDVDQLSRYIIELANDNNLKSRLGNNAQKFAVEHLDIQIKEAKLETIYEKTTQNKEEVELTN